MRVSMHWNYFQICRTSLREYEEIEIKMDSHRESNDEEHIKQTESRGQTR